MVYCGRAQAGMVRVRDDSKSNILSVAIKDHLARNYSNRSAPMALTITGMPKTIYGRVCPREDCSELMMDTGDMCWGKHVNTTYDHHSIVAFRHL